MPRNDHGVSTLTLIILIVSVILAALVAVLVTHQHEVATRPATVAASRPPLTADAKAYLSTLTFGEFRMSAAANYLGHTQTYLDGSVSNPGTKAVRNLEVELNFVDTLNQVVLRETAHPLADHSAPLQPGETHAFRVTFEHMPMDWNQSPPSAKVVYGEFSN
jgi:hypothetical protein